MFVVKSTNKFNNQNRELIIIIIFGGLLSVLSNY